MTLRNLFKNIRGIGPAILDFNITRDHTMPALAVLLVIAVSGVALNIADEMKREDEKHQYQLEKEREKKRRFERCDKTTRTLGEWNTCMGWSNR